jgi:hypothetical protein
MGNAMRCLMGIESESIGQCQFPRETRQAHVKKRAGHEGARERRNHPTSSLDLCLSAQNNHATIPEPE